MSISAVGIVGISCPTASWCMAVDGDGKAVNYSNGSWGTPVVVDNGARSTSATGEFDGVSCATTTFCMAVSYVDGYSLFQNGTWGPMTAPPGSIPSSYHGVSCTSSSFCAAESDNFGDLTFYMGGSWSDPTTNNGIGIGNSDSTPISCAGTFCMYVTGDKYQTSSSGVLSKEATIDTAATNDLAPNVSCTAPTACVVAFGTGGVVDVWNGSAFTTSGDIVSKSVNGPGLNAVSCTGTFCAAAGAKRLYTSSDGGSTWTDVGAFTTSGVSSAIACPSNSLCFIGGAHGSAYAVNPTPPITPA